MLLTGLEGAMTDRARLSFYFYTFNSHLMNFRDVIFQIMMNEVNEVKKESKCTSAHYIFL